MPSSLSLRPPSPEVMTSRHFQVSWDTKSLQYVWSLETLHIGSLAAALLWDTLNDQTDAYFSSLYSFSFTHTSWVSVGLVINNQINNFSFMLRPLWCLIKKSKQLLLVAVHFKRTHFCNNTVSFSYCTTFSNYVRVATMLLLVLQVVTCNTSNNIVIRWVQLCTSGCRTTVRWVDKEEKKPIIHAFFFLHTWATISWLWSMCRKEEKDGVVYNFSCMPIWTFSIGQKGKSMLVTYKPQRTQSDVKAKQQINIPHWLRFILLVTMSHLHIHTSTFFYIECLICTLRWINLGFIAGLNHQLSDS